MGLLSVTWSKSLRIKIMIGIDTSFFLLELISGFLVHSLALTADAFHMLNDIISLIIGLWAVVAAQKETTDEFTFGWVRAEILGAFFNAVFLIALCVSIILEALTRFVEPPEITNPVLILSVGCAGLFSNLVGFFVLGGHGHSHGGDDHDHDHDHEHEHGHNHTHGHSHGHDEEQGLLANTDEPIRHAADAGPEVVIRRATETRASSDDQTRRIRFDETEHANREESRATRGSQSSRGRDGRRSSKSSQNHSRLASIEDMSIHPASFRQDIISLAASSGAGDISESDTDENGQSGDQEQNVDEESPLLKDQKKGNGTLNVSKKCKGHNETPKGRHRRDSSVHVGHNHTLPRKPGKKGGHGHSHGDMGMNAMILHVIGDALGNVGVIVTALIIWLTDWPGKLYADPAVSLFITAIILKTAIPLTRATSRVLLQATPENICIADIRQDIEALPGVVSCHHIHVWQLSDTKVVASMHLQVSFPIDTNSGEKYMQLARRARKCLHAFGIHSATIQPEFCLDTQHAHEIEAANMRLDGAADGQQNSVCLLECVDDCAAPGCCPGSESMSQGSSLRRASNSSQGSGHHH